MLAESFETTRLLQKCNAPLSSVDMSDHHQLLSSARANGPCILSIDVVPLLNGYHAHHVLKHQAMCCRADGYDTAQDDEGASIYLRAVIRKRGAVQSDVLCRVIVSICITTKRHVLFV
jgi:hypothetical protein